MCSSIFVWRIFALVGVLGAVQPVGAQSPPVQMQVTATQDPGVPPSSCAESEEAKQRYDFGIGLLGQNRNNEALGEFQRSYELSHCMRALAQMAFAEKALRRWADASEHLRTAMASSDPWIEERRMQFQTEQLSIEDSLRLAGGRNEETTTAKPAPQTPTRVRAGWGLTIAGVLLGGAGAATMSVAQALARSLKGVDFDMWAAGEAVYGAALPTGGVLLGVGGAALVTGATLLLLPQKEPITKQSQIWLSPTSNGFALGGVF
jgi:hypothetical protein